MHNLYKPNCINSYISQEVTSYISVSLQWLIMPAACVVL